MLKIGDKVSFTRFLLMDPVRKRELKSKKNINPFENYRMTILNRQVSCHYGKMDGDIMTKYEPYADIKEPLDGTFVGYRYRKLYRIYDVSKPAMRTMYRMDRYSTSQRRVDNPRSLHKVALVSVSNTKIIEVPYYNLIENTFKTMYKIL